MDDKFKTVMIAFLIVVVAFVAISVYALTKTNSTANNTTISNNTTQMGNTTNATSHTNSKSSKNIKNSSSSDKSAPGYYWDPDVGGYSYYPNGYFNDPNHGESSDSGADDGYVGPYNGSN